MNAKPNRSVQDEMIIRIKSLDREERLHRKRQYELETEAALERARADALAAKRGLYEVLIRDSLGVVIVIPDFPPEPANKPVSVKVNNAQQHAPLGRVES